MAKVSNLVIKKQSGVDNGYYATWSFNENTKTTTVSKGTIKAKDLVSIKSGTKTWYNGVAIPSWVFNYKWKVVENINGRVVLGESSPAGYNIQSPIKESNLVGGSGGGSSTTTINTTKEYRVDWWYKADGVWFRGTSGTTVPGTKNSTYSAPENAVEVKVSVKPNAKTHKVNGKDTAYWTGSWVSAYHKVEIDPPDVPPMPTVDIDKFKLTMKVENITDSRTDQIQYEIYNGEKKIHTATITVSTARAVYSYTVAAGGEYRVRARAVNLYGNNKNYSEWTNYTSSVHTMPVAPSGITVIRAASSTSVYLEWSAASGADTYDIEYATDERYFEGSDATTVISGIETTKYEKTGLESGDEYFFRVRATNDQGSSSWTAIKSVIIGKKPGAPTTWSSTTTAITGEPLILYWVHNAEDNSKMTYAKLELTIDDEPPKTETIKGVGNDNDEAEEYTYQYPLDTTQYPEGTSIKWRVQTAGITMEYGDWSIQRTVDIYAPPTLELSLTDSTGVATEILSSFPFKIEGTPGPKTQAPIGYHLTITSETMYETVDAVGNPKYVDVGDEVYSKYFDINTNLEVQLSASDLDLENNASYTVTCIVSMDSGLTAESTLTFTVSWEDVAYEPDAEITIDTEILTAYIKPYVSDEEGYLIEGLTLSVYRREFDGSYTEIATGLDNAENITVTDPHPALDYARYRILCMTNSTGAVAYYDCPGYPMNESGVVIQWDERWSTFDVTSEAEFENPPWAGSFLKIPYNIDVSNNHDTDVTLVKYIGRRRPVSYYGTQLGETATWNMVIPATDKETLYQIRRLSIWTGDVYVREPSGSGYWANISVSYNQKHNDLTIPITLNVTPVEGGA